MNPLLSICPLLSSLLLPRDPIMTTTLSLLSLRNSQERLFYFRQPSFFEHFAIFSSRLPLHPSHPPSPCRFVCLLFFYLIHLHRTYSEVSNSWVHRDFLSSLNKFLTSLEYWVRWAVFMLSLESKLSRKHLTYDVRVLKHKKCKECANWFSNTIGVGRWNNTGLHGKIHVIQVQVNVLVIIFFTFLRKVYKAHSE